MTRLRVNELGIGYPGRLVGRDLSFSLAAGTILCLLGPNGGGKTTLLKTVLGLLAPRAGRIQVDGADTRGWSARRRALTFSYVPQSGGGQFPFTVREMVLMGRAARSGLFSTPSPADRDAAEAALATLGITHLAERDWLRLSGGERQLTLLARALAQEPAIMVLDEPTASLDFGNQVLVLDQIRRLAGAGLTILFSTHQPEHAFACADQVGMLHDGAMVRLGPPLDAVTSASMRLVYGIDVDLLPVAPGHAMRVCVPHAYTMRV